MYFYPVHLSPQSLPYPLSLPYPPNFVIKKKKKPLATIRATHTLLDHGKGPGVHTIVGN